MTPLQARSAAFSIRIFLFFVILAAPGWAGRGGAPDGAPGPAAQSTSESTSGAAAAPSDSESPTTPPPPSRYDSSSDGKRKDSSSGGPYVDLLGRLMIATESTHGWNANCPVVSYQPDPLVTPLTVGGQCSVQSPIGLAAGGRLGISFGALGLEGFAIGAADWSSASIDSLEQLFTTTGVPPVLQDMQIGRIGGGLGGGLRLMTPEAPVRLSLGGGGGLALRHVYTNLSSLGSGTSEGYVAPLVTADLTLTLFNFASLGAFVWVEFLDGPVEVMPDFSQAGFLQQPLQQAVGPITAFQGTQLFFGPQLSLHMGN